MIPCEKCGHKTILASGEIVEFFPDQEPYENGKIEDCGYDGTFTDGFTTDPIYVNIHFCPECRHVNNDASIDIG